MERKQGHRGSDINCTILCVLQIKPNVNFRHETLQLMHKMFQWNSTSQNETVDASKINVTWFYEFPYLWIRNLTAVNVDKVSEFRPRVVHVRSVHVVFHKIRSGRALKFKSRVGRVVPTAQILLKGAGEFWKEGIFWSSMMNFDVQCLQILKDLQCDTLWKITVCKYVNRTLGDRWEFANGDFEIWKVYDRPELARFSFWIGCSDAKRDDESLMPLKVQVARLWSSFKVFQECSGIHCRERQTLRLKVSNGLCRN